MIGIDLVDVGRLERALRRAPSLAARVFSDDERRRASGRILTIAGQFAAKEATFKGLGVGIDSGYSLRDVEIGRLPSGGPSVELRGEVAEYARSLGLHSPVVTLSHDGRFAVALVLFRT